LCVILNIEILKGGYVMLTQIKFSVESRHRKMIKKNLWKIVEDEFYTDHAIAVFEYKGIPIIITQGNYPLASNGTVTTRDHAYIEIYLSSQTHSKTHETNDEIITTVTNYYYGFSIYIFADSKYNFGGRLCLNIFEYKTEKNEEYFYLINESFKHIEKAIEELEKLPFYYDQYYKKLEELHKYEKFINREDYENACRQHTVDILTDEECNSYGVKFGYFSFPEYSVDYCVKMRLAYLRFLAIEDMRKQKQKHSKNRISIIEKQGQLWEQCEHCKKEPVYLPLNLCDDCWPNN
jgi:hypothetical protein